MKRITALFISVLFIALLACGCAQEQAAEVNGSDLTTKEYIIEHFDLEKSSLDAIDVDGVIDYFQIKNDDVNSWSDAVAKLTELEAQMIDEKSRPLPNLEYIFEGDAAQKEFSASDIKYIAFEEDDGIFINTYIIDAGNKTKYYAEGTQIIENCTVAEDVHEINAELFGMVLDALDESKIYEWKDFYAGEFDDTTAYYRWVIGIELNDGSVFTYGGYGVTGDYKPLTFDAVVECITEI